MTSSKYSNHNSTNDYFVFTFESSYSIDKYSRVGESENFSVSSALFPKDGL